MRTFDFLQQLFPRRYARTFARLSGSSAVEGLKGQIAGLAERRKLGSGHPLDELIKEAWRVGQAIDLSGVGYGPPHWRSEERLSNKTFSYYFFLSGLVQTQHCQRILEIGTHYGGSAQAMLRGGAKQIVTIDVTDLNSSLHQIDGITKLTGDANSEAMISKVLVAFSAEPVDLIYIDAAHEFFPTIQSLGVYATLLRPRFVVMDDIILNESMRVMWNVVCTVYGPKAINCVEVVPEIRNAGCGFGLLRQ